MKSSYTVINTVTGPEDYIAYLQPSEEATTLHYTNTYYSRLTITRMLHDQIASKRFVSDEAILTQVVITESLAGRGTLQETMNMEHGYVHIYATRSVMETVTYLAKPFVSTHKEMLTEVIKRVITDVVPSSLLQPELLSTFRTQLILKNERHNSNLVTKATLLDGQILQVTALSLSTNLRKGFGEKSDFQKITSSSANSESSIKKTRNQNESGFDFYHDLVNESEDNSLNISETQHQYEYRKPPVFDAISKTPSISTVENIIGAFNLKKFRPVFHVMADLLQKNIDVNPGKKQKLNELGKNNLTVDERPTYIPIKLAGFLEKITSPITNNMTTYPKLNRLTAQSLNISPPQVHNLEENNTFFPIHKHHTLISHGIPIRPGEIINANADVIIGRPNGITQQLVYPLKKTWLAQSPATFPSHSLSNSLMPPLPFAAANFQRMQPEHHATINMLRPPTPSYFRSSTRPLFFNKPNQQITNLNGELSSNEIIEILQIPQIFSTKLPVVTKITYSKVDSTAFSNILPSAHHRISLKTHVLRHDVDVNVPPLTFKLENDNFPVATAVRGHISLATVPLVKIPANKAQLEVRLTPNSNRLDETSISIEKEPQSELRFTSSFKQLNQNLLKHDRLNIPVANKIALFSSNTWKTVNPKSESSKRNDTVHMPSQKNHNLMLLKPIHKFQQNQSFDNFKIFHANNSLPYHNSTLNSPRNSIEIDMLSLSSTRPGDKSINLGQPFVTQKQSQNSFNDRTQVKSDLHKKLYLATGEPFNLKSAGPLNTINSEIIANEVQTQKPKLYLESEGKLRDVSVLDSSISSYNNKLLVSKIALRLSSSSSVRSLYGTATTSILSATYLSQKSYTASSFSQKHKHVSTNDYNVTLPMNTKHSAYSFAAESSVINTKPIFQFGTNIKEQIVLEKKSEKISMATNTVASLITKFTRISSLDSYITNSIHPNQTLSFPSELQETLNENNDLLPISNNFGISKLLIFSSEPDNYMKEIVKTVTDFSLIIQSVIEVNTSRNETNAPILFTNLTTKSLEKMYTIRPNISKYSVIMTNAPRNYSINNNSISDFDENTSFELPSRDEEFVPPLNSNSVALGGVLIATSLKTQYDRPPPDDLKCNPSCKSANNEVCSYIADFGSSCECRLGFARMFPDRPCKRKYS